MKKVIFSIRVNPKEQHSSLKEPFKLYYECLKWLYFKLMETCKYEALYMLKNEVINRPSLFCKGALHKILEVIGYEKAFDNSRKIKKNNQET